ncbi:hypothetical protein [Streptomyces mirabilis]|uniref:hypothetical protein n=1 Tax=Streptomyces mirabilis TaxID=68239 RepID=UPI00364D0C12
MGNTNPTQGKNKPPTAGSRPSVRIDDGLAADLADIMGAGDITFADAVRRAVGQLAEIYRTAWAHEVCPPGTAPVVLAYQLGRPRPPMPVAGGYDASDTRPPRPVGRLRPGPPPAAQLRPTYADTMIGRRTPTAPPARPDAQRPPRA